MVTVAHVFKTSYALKKIPSLLQYICRMRTQKSNWATLLTFLNVCRSRWAVHSKQHPQPGSACLYDQTWEQHWAAALSQWHTGIASSLWQLYKYCQHRDRIFTCNDANEILNHYYMKIVILSSAKVRLLGVSICSKKKKKTNLWNKEDLRSGLWFT